MPAVASTLTARDAMPDDGEPYEASHPSSVLWALWHCSHHGPSTFVDLGCGDGWPLALAAMDGRFARLVGVERDHDRVLAARRGLRAFPQIDIEEKSAAEWTPPTEQSLLVYMFNPFGHGTMAAVERTLRAHKGAVDVAYINAVHADIFADWDVVAKDEARCMFRRPTQMRKP